MTNFVLVGDGVVLQSDRSGAEPEGFVEAPDEVCPGYLFDGQGFSPPIPPPPERAKVPKSTVMQRLIDINMMDQAYFLLSSQPKFFARWFAPDHPSVFCDDPDAVAFVTALALDPAVILASETAA